MLRRNRFPAILAFLLVVAACTPTGKAPGPTDAPAATPPVTSSGSSSSTATSTTPTTTQPAPEAGAFVGAYSFPPGVIDLGWLRQPTRIEAVIGVPEGEGPFPVVVFLHGLGKSCITPQETGGPYRTIEWNPPCSVPGTEYLRTAFVGSEIVAAAARRGMVGIAIDVNAAYFWWGGEVSESAVMTGLVETHISILQELASGAVRLPGLDHPFTIDPDRLGLVGHSRGGSYVEALAGTDDPSFVAIGGTPSALVLLGTAGSIGDPDRPLPTLNVRAECDADVGSTAGLDFIETMKGLGAPLVVDALVAGASHWTMTSYPLAGPTSDCASGASDPAGDAVEVARLVASFLAGVLNDQAPILVADEQHVTIAVLAGSAEIDLPDGPPEAGAGPVEITQVDEARLDPIQPGDRFLTDEQLEDF